MNPHNIVSADERNDTIAQLSLATDPYPGEKSKKHKEIQIMKRYLSLVLALPTCPHLIEEVDVFYDVWVIIDCENMVRTVERTYMCVICSYTYKTRTKESKAGNHTWLPNEGNDKFLYRYKCVMCGAKK